MKMTMSQKILAAHVPGRARSPSAPPSPIPARLRRLANLLKQGLITEEEHAAQRTRILNEL